MGGEGDMLEHIAFTLEVADKILASSGEDSLDALTKAVGTLAQVIHITVHDEYREETLNAAIDMLRNYLAALDEVSGIGSLGVGD